MQQKEYFKKLAKNEVTALGFEFIKDQEGVFPAVRQLSEIAGSASILIASEIMSITNEGNGLMFGNISGVPPTEVVIIGAGIVGEFATRAAIGLGQMFVFLITRLQSFVHCKPILDALFTLLQCSLKICKRHLCAAMLPLGQPKAITGLLFW